MKKRIAGSIAMAVMLSTVLFSGCSKKVTAENLVEEMNKKIESAKSYEAVMDMDMSMTIEAEGIEMDIDMSMDGDIEAIADPALTHMNMTMEMSLLGLSMDVEMYTQVEDDQVTVYTGMAGEWVKVAQDLTEDVNVGNLTINVGDPSKLTLAEKTETLDGGEAYVLAGSVSGEELEGVLQSAESLMDGISDMDLSGVQADTTLWIYKETGYPARMEVVIAGEGLSAEADGVTTSITNLSVMMDYKGFDTIENIEIPAEALSAQEVDSNSVLVE